MNAKEYLQQYRDADREINAKLDQIRRLRELATKTTQTLTTDRVQTSAENKVEGIVQKIVDLQQEVNEEIDKLTKIRRDVQSVILSVSDSARRNVLRLRYVQGMSWEQIAVELNYTYRHVMRLHGEALQQINMSLNVLKSRDIV